MFKKKGELPIPDVARSDEAALEIARIWSAGGGQLVSLRVGVWRDPAAWGIALADVARHVASAYAEQGHRLDDALRRIRDGFDAEWAHPTDGPSPGGAE
jgi:hypothetical protein